MQLSFVIYYKLIYTQKQENTKISTNVPGSNKQGGDEEFQSLSRGYLTIIRANRRLRYGRRSKSGRFLFDFIDGRIEFRKFFLHF